jgi:regulator of sirC expression with transglutaminase-like and TPR domain
LYGADYVHSSCTAVQAVQCLLHLLFGMNWRFGNTDDYYNLANSSVNYVVANRQGNGLALVLLFRCILQKIYVETSVIALPGLVVLGVTERNGAVFYFDVFRPDGEPWTAHDCRSFVADQDVAWQDSLLEPLTPTAILLHMLDNMEQAAFRPLLEPLSMRSRVLLERFLLLQETMTRNIQDASLEMVPLTLDPEVFREYGLLAVDPLEDEDRFRNWDLSLDGFKAKITLVPSIYRKAPP